MKKLLLAIMVLVSAGGAFAQDTEPKGMEYIDSAILADHHYDPRVKKVDTNYTIQSKKVSEHYFIDTTANVLERAVVQVHHSATNSTIEYYFFLNNALARVQKQHYRRDQFSDAEIHYFQNNTPLDCSRKNKAACQQYVQKAKDMIDKLKAAGS